MSSERSLDSDSMARRLRGLASIGSLEDRRRSRRWWHGMPRSVVHTVAVPRRRPAVLATAIVVVLAALASACSSEDGRALPPPNPSTTTSTATTTTSSAIGAPAGDEGLQEVFSLFSTAFGEGGEIPPRYTCGGEDVSPPLDWVAAPPDAPLALVVRDSDADGFVHWVLAGIDASVHGLGEDGIPESAVEAANGFGTTGWSGPCPTAGSGLHTYVFTLHALSEPLALGPGTPGADAAALVEAASIAQATLTGTASG